MTASVFWCLWWDDSVRYIVHWIEGNMTWPCTLYRHQGKHTTEITININKNIPYEFEANWAKLKRKYTLSVYCAVWTKRVFLHWFKYSNSVWQNWPSLFFIPNCTSSPWSFLWKFQFHLKILLLFICELRIQQVFLLLRTNPPKLRFHFIQTRNHRQPSIRQNFFTKHPQSIC